MELIKHTIDEDPPRNKELLMLIDIGAEAGCLLWTVGIFDKTGWVCSFDEIGYEVIEWYELPPRERAVDDDYSYHQMRLEEFWSDK